MEEYTFRIKNYLFSVCACKIIFAIRNRVPKFIYSFFGWKNIIIYSIGIQTAEEDITRSKRTGSDANERFFGGVPTIRQAVF